MTRTEVYQLRLTAEEKVALVERAKGRGLSVAQMIRTDYGLARDEDARMAEADMGVGAETLDDASAPTEDEVKRLALQLYSRGKTKRQARLEAEQQLGLK